MKVKELLVILAEADPESTVVVEGDDHSYRPCWSFSTTARTIGGDFFEDYPGDLSKGEKRVPVVVFN